MDIVISKSGVPIRLTEERWYHIVENHDDLAGYYDEVLLTVENPDFVMRGYRGALLLFGRWVEGILGGDI
jgi:hypothetical protein